MSIANSLWLLLLLISFQCLEIIVTLELLQQMNYNAVQTLMMDQL